MKWVDEPTCHSIGSQPIDKPRFPSLFIAGSSTNYSAGVICTSCNLYQSPQILSSVFLKTLAYYFQLNNLSGPETAITGHKITAQTPRSKKRTEFTHFRRCRNCPRRRGIPLIPPLYPLWEITGAKGQNTCRWLVTKAKVGEESTVIIE